MTGPDARSRSASRRAAPWDLHVEAARVVRRVARRGDSLSRVLPPRLERLGDAHARALVQELSFGTLRWYWRLEAQLDGLLERPLRARDADVHALMLVGLYRLLEQDLPHHAAVDVSVRAVRALGKEWAAGLVNAVLRSWLRRQDADEDRGDARYAHPPWLLAALRRDWPDHWRAIVEAGNRRPPLHLRVNTARVSVKDYLERLAQAGLDARRLAHTLAGVAVRPAVPVARLPGFDAGLVSVQDGAAQLAAPQLALAPGQRVLDACAAPGGKSAHIAELEPGLTGLLALDHDPGRHARLCTGLQRLGVRAQVRLADARRPEHWWDGRPYDRILLDAPCSGTGVLRRHPDIKLLRRASDIDAFARTQDELLDALWPLLAPGGRLLYATCSLLVQENGDRIQAFLSRQPQARVRPIRVPWGRAGSVGRQILTGEEDMDGFYYACLERA